MKRVLVLLVAACLLSIVLVACDDKRTLQQSQPATLTPVPCVTATPVVGNITSSGMAMATPAGRTTPFSESPGAQLPVSPSDLATREAQLEQKNRPVQVPTADKFQSFPVCPTPTPVK